MRSCKPNDIAAALRSALCPANINMGGRGNLKVQKVPCGIPRGVEQSHKSREKEEKDQLSTD